MTSHGDLFRAINGMDESDELKEVLRLMVDYTDYEDEKTLSESVKMFRKEIKELRERIGFLEEEME